MNQKQLAEALGIDPAMVSRLKRQGMPVHSVEAARAWRDANVEWRRSKGVRLNADAATTAPPPPSQVAVPLTGATVWENRARREAAEADLAELRLEELRAALVRVDDVRAALARRAVSFREALLHMPDRLSAQMAGESDQHVIAATLDAEIRHALSLLFDAPDATREGKL